MPKGSARDAPARPRARRGRPSKYGQPSQVVAMTLPKNVVDALHGLHSDLGWAVVRLVEKTRRVAPTEDRTPDAQLVEVGPGRFLIVVNIAAFKRLPGVQMVRLSETQAFLALDPGRGMSDLEVTVLDRLARVAPGGREHRALAQLRNELRRWRLDRRLTAQPRSIIIVTNAGAGNGR